MNAKDDAVSDPNGEMDEADSQQASRIQIFWQRYH